MIVRLGSLAALALAFAPASLHAQAAPALRATSPDAVRLGLGREIAELLNSESITRLQFDKMFAETIPKTYMAIPEMVELEKQYPGIVTYVIAQMRTPLEQLTLKRLPVLVERLAPIYATMSEPELRQTLAFFNSPTGTWMLDRMARGIDYSAMMSRLASDPDAPTTDKDQRDAMRAAVPGLARGMTPQRTRDILAFAATSAGVKVRTLNPRLLAASTQWTNESDPAGEKIIEEIVIKAVRDYIDRAAKGGGKKLSWVLSAPTAATVRSAKAAI